MDVSIDKIVEEEIKLAKTRIQEEWKLKKRRIEEELKLTRTRIDEEFRLIETRVEQICTSTKAKIVTRIQSFVEDGNPYSPHRRMKLEFRNKISQPIWTGKEIKGEGHTPIEVILVDGYTEDIVDVGPEASANVEIVALRAKADDCEGDDELAVEDCNNKVVLSREGKKPLLAGNISLKLQRGICILDNIKFRHYASKIKPSVFRLEARIVDKFAGARVMEAKTESFLVKDYHGKYSMKHDLPSLSDKVWRLKSIRKGGTFDKRLQVLKIHTVEEFLVQLLINPEGLKRTVNMVAKKWAVTVNHARATPSAHKVYCYINSEQKKGIVFNLLGHVLGLYLEGHYRPANELSENHKDDLNKLKACALEHWDHIFPIKDGNALEQHLSRLKTDHAGGCDRAVASEIIGESSNRNSNSPFLVPYSRGSGIEYLGPLTIDDIEIMDDPLWERVYDPSFNAQSMFEDFDIHVPDDSGGMLYKDLKDELNMEQDMAESGIVLVESHHIVPLCKATKRWTKLFCVTMWFLVMRGVALKGGCYTKRQSFLTSMLRKDRERLPKILLVKILITGF